VAEPVDLSFPAAPADAGTVQALQDVIDRIGQVAGVGGWQLNLADGVLTWTAQTCRIHDQPIDHVPTLEEAISYYSPEVRAVLEAAILRGIEHGEGWDLELPLQTAAGRAIWVRAQGTVEQQRGKASRLIGTLQDITERRRDIDALIASERRFRSLFTYSLGLICTHDVHGVLLSVNPAACQSLGYAMTELVNRPLADLMPAADAQQVPAYLARITTRGSDEGRLRFLAADGSVRVWQYRNVVDVSDGETVILGHAQDITDQVLQEQRLRESAVRDALTGCYNRRHLAEMMASGGFGERWACVAIDLDGFKLINDTYGHAQGDDVLVRMAAFFRAHIRDQDQLLRLGGDEFLIMQPQATAEDALACVERLAGANNAPCTFTAGVAEHRVGRTMEATLAEADADLYRLRRHRRR
jgi:diguanylate cyclase (GGDEF)-like protein/PAS domain S-box-containing protein